MVLNIYPRSAFSLLVHATTTKAGNEHSRDIVTKFLNSDPTQRLGNLADGMDEARRHPYFAEIDWNALAHKTMPVRVTVLTVISRLNE